MKTLKYFLSVLFVILLLAVINVGLNSVNSSERDDFDKELINQHLDVEVSFTERYRPQFHYTPRINWMNDPNGLVYYEEQYHLFHQYNPFGDTWGYMSWNHAVSDDMIHWEHRPVAIPYGKEKEEAIFSGSAVVDHNNTSEFGDGSRAPLVAIYTSHYTLDDGTTDQAQSLAYSIDGGKTFEKYEGNPVIVHDDRDFRDPNVMWIDDMDQWLMVVALPLQHKVLFYASDNLIDWEYLSDFGPDGATGGKWECPDMFQLPIDGDPENTRWVLHVDINPGAVAGGSGSQYFVGEWDGTNFIPEEYVSDSEVMWVDYGTDFYAAITWNDIPEEDGRRIWVGWMNNWEYANEIPTKPWRSAQSIPRSIHLKKVDENVQMIQRPVKELQTLRGKRIELQNFEVNNNAISLSDQGIYGKTYELIVELDPGDVETAGLKLRAGEDEETIVGYDAVSETIFVDRKNSGDTSFNKNFATRNDAPVSLNDGKLRLHIFVDWSSVEVFVNGGTRILTNRIFPAPESRDIILFAEGGTALIENIDFWSLQSIWE